MSIRMALISLLLLFGATSGYCEDPSQINCDNQLSANADFNNYKTTIANFPIIASSVSYYYPGSIGNHSASYFQGLNQGSIGTVAAADTLFPDTFLRTTTAGADGAYVASSIWAGDDASHTTSSAQQLRELLPRMEYWVCILRNRLPQHA